MARRRAQQPTGQQDSQQDSQPNKPPCSPKPASRVGVVRASLLAANEPAVRRSPARACGTKSAAPLKARYPVHVTWRVVRQLPSLRRDKLMAAIRRAFVKGKDRFQFRLVHYSVQHNHVHMLCEAPNARELARGLNGLAVRVAKAVNRALKRKGKVFADRYHNRILTTPSQVRWALGYVLCNTRRHNAELLRPRRYPRRWLDYAGSSAVHFPGFHDRGKLVSYREPALVTGWSPRAPGCSSAAGCWSARSLPTMCRGRVRVEDAGVQGGPVLRPRTSPTVGQPLANGLDRTSQTPGMSGDLESESEPEAESESEPESEPEAEAESEGRIVRIRRTESAESSQRPSTNRRAGSDGRRF